MNLALLYRELRRDEGDSLVLYRCKSGKQTIGVGRNVEDRGVSKEESDFMLRNDVDIVLHEIKRVLPQFDAYTEIRKRALANMFFALGMTKFLGFKKMIAAIKDGRRDDAADELLDSRWVREVGQRAVRLSIMVHNGR